MKTKMMITVKLKNYKMKINIEGMQMNVSMKEVKLKLDNVKLIG